MRVWSFEVGGVAECRRDLDHLCAIHLDHGIGLGIQQDGRGFLGVGLRKDVVSFRDERGGEGGVV
jgi:hypothetical protein